MQSSYVGKMQDYAAAVNTFMR